MILYNESGGKVRHIIKEENNIGSGIYGTVYRLSQDECIKIYKGLSSREIDIEAVKTIKNLYLRNFYAIHELLYTKNGNLKGYTMKYYDNEEIDILTMPTDYTLDNLFTLLNSVKSLTANNIRIRDMKEGNIIMNSADITVIDVDLYSFNRYYIKKSLGNINITALQDLLIELYISAINKYHNEYDCYNTSELLRNTFTLYSDKGTTDTCKKLVKYKYPIDYIRSKSK